jgi:hypothetical protein
MLGVYSFLFQSIASGELGVFNGVGKFGWI